jgi:hypothetical protein
MGAALRSPCFLGRAVRFWAAPLAAKAASTTAASLSPYRYFDASAWRHEPGAA